MIPRWIVYSFVFSRAVVLSILVGLFLFESHFKDLIPVVIKQFPPVSYRNVYQGITAFRILNNLYIPLIVFLLALPGCYFLNHIFKSNRIWVDALALTGLSYGVFSFFLFQLPLSYLFVFLTLSLVVLKINRIQFEAWIGRNTVFCYGIASLFVLFPLLAELLLPCYLIFMVRNAKMKTSKSFSRPFWNRFVLYAAIGISANLMISAFTFWSLRTRLFQELNSERLFRKAERLISGDFYTMHIDAATRRLFAAAKGDRRLYIFDLDDLSRTPRKVKIGIDEVQDVRINDLKRELYYFDRGSGLLMVYDIDSLELKRRSRSPLEGRGSGRVAFDNRSGTIVVTREYDFLWIVDMETLEPLHRLEIGDRNESIVFSEKINRYILSYFENFSLMRLVSPDGEHILEIEVPQHQAGIAVSNQNDEFYVALPLRGEIFVHDLKTFALKRKIPTVFGVRGIAYGEKDNILVAASVCAGYVDVIDLETDRSMSRHFVGYYLREIVLNFPENEAFISSLIGGIYRLDLKSKN